MGAGLIRAPDHCHWPPPHPPMVFPRELLWVALPWSGGGVELMLGILAFEAPAPPPTHGPDSGGKRGGLRVLQGGPGGPEGWAKLENLPGGCPHHAMLWSQGRVHLHTSGTQRR